jgi:dipeptidase
MMKCRILLLIAAMLVVVNANSIACTNFLVTKGASKDGSTIISYNADSFTFYGELYHFPPGVYPDGTMVDVYEWDTGKLLGSIKQAPVTYNVVGNMNEFQLALGETTFGGREECHNTKGIVDYGSLIYFALQRAKTAREAIKMMVDIVSEYGYYSEGESFSIADPNEAWILEMVGHGDGEKGALWVAARIPDGYVSAHANQARITTFPLNDPDNYLYAPDVITYARAKGWFKGADAEFSFSDVYAPLEFGAVRFCDARVWSMYRHVNSTMDKYLPYINGEKIERLPMFVKPDHKLSVQDVMHLMRDHFEGTDLDVTKGIAAGWYGTPVRWRPLTWEYQGQQYFNERPISTPQTGFAFVSQSRSFLPNEIGGVLWFGVDDTYMNVYVPMYACMTKTPYNYSKGVGSLSQFTWESAFWAFNFVSNFTYPKYNLVIHDVQAVQSELEGMFAGRQETVEKTALMLSKSSKGEAIDYLTNYSNEMAGLTYTRWKKLGEQLLVKYMDGVVKDENCKPINVGYPEEFKKLIVQESGDKFKMKKLPGSDEHEYAEHITAADTLLKGKKFGEAKDLYKKALNLKPNEGYPRVQIEKIDKILSEIEELYKKDFTR